MATSKNIAIFARLFEGPLSINKSTALGVLELEHNQPLAFEMWRAADELNAFIVSEMQVQMTTKLHCSHLKHGIVQYNLADAVNFVAEPTTEYPGNLTFDDGMANGLFFSVAVKRSLRT